MKKVDIHLTSKSSENTCRNPSVLQGPLLGPYCAVKIKTISMPWKCSIIMWYVVVVFLLCSTSNVPPLLSISGAFVKACFGTIQPFSLPNQYKRIIWACHKNGHTGSFAFLWSFLETVFTNMQLTNVKIQCLKQQNVAEGEAILSIITMFSVPILS